MSEGSGTTGDHWDDAYSGGDTARSWFQPQAATSIRVLAGAGISRGAAVVDVGGGASTLVDGLLAAGFTDLTVLDVSAVGMTIARKRLGRRSEQVTWVTCDLLSWRPDRSFDVWHDRAVLHFMTTDPDRSAYRETLLAATSAGSVAVLGVFGPQGPQACSGLPVQRWSTGAMAEFLGSDFRIAQSFTEAHVTPAGARQQFLWVAAERQ